MVRSRRCISEHPWAPTKPPISNWNWLWKCLEGQKSRFCPWVMPTLVHVVIKGMVWWGGGCWHFLLFLRSRFQLRLGWWTRWRSWPTKTEFYLDLPPQWSFFMKLWGDGPQLKKANMKRRVKTEHSTIGHHQQHHWCSLKRSSCLLDRCSHDTLYLPESLDQLYCTSPESIASLSLDGTASISTSMEIILEDYIKMKELDR